MAGMCLIVPRGGIGAGYDHVPGERITPCDFPGAVVPLSRALPVRLTAAERKILKERARGARTPHRDRVRAQIVLAAGRGRDNARIAADLRITADTVRKWRGRFAARGLDGLTDLPRPGRPRRISAADRAAVVALACQLPAATGVPLSRWTGPELAAELAAQGLVSSPVSASSVLRILAEHPVKPWQYQSWIYPRAPDFAAKAKVILDLYQGFYQGKRLGLGDRILSVDAKPSIQARGRCHPTAPAAPGKPMRVEHEYVRNGALALLAALDVRTGQVFAATPETTGITPFMNLMGQVMSQPGYKNASRVFVIVDNGSDHRGQAAIDRLRAAHPSAIMIHTPVHASWLNQAEIFFSIIQKKVVTPNDFASTGELCRTLLTFVDRYNLTAQPFNWKFTADDLTALLRRISEREQATASQQADLPQAA
jgi:transposase